MPDSAPSLTPEETHLIRTSFDAVLRRPVEAAAQFYEALFSEAPGVRGLFHGDMRTQGQKLIATLSLLVSRLDDLPSLEPALAELGRRHRNYRVDRDHYSLVRRALLRMLSVNSGPEWSPAAECAWGRIYDHVAATMMAAADGQLVPSTSASAPV